MQPFVLHFVEFFFTNFIYNFICNIRNRHICAWSQATAKLLLELLNLFIKNTENLYFQAISVSKENTVNYAKIMLQQARIMNVYK